MKRLLSIILILLLCAGCRSSTRSVGGEPGESEQDQRIAFRASVERQLRLNAVSAALLTAAVKMGCGNVTRKYGFGIFRRDDFKPEYQEGAFGYFGRENVVTFVGKGTAAERGGLSRGDLILTINGVALERMTQKDLKGALQKPNIDLIAAGDDGSKRKVAIKALPACDCQVTLMTEVKINTRLETGRIMVTSGLVRFTENDSELAMVVGYEIGRTIVELRKRKQLSADDEITPVDEKKTGRRYEYDIAAAMVRMASLAGYNTTEGVRVWRRLTHVEPASVDALYLRSHASPEQLTAIDRAVKDIRVKQKPVQSTAQDKRRSK